jgi:hypothetical protein
MKEATEMREVHDVQEKQKSRFLTKSLILQALDLPTKDIEVPEWGGVVRVRSLTGAERDEFETTMVTEKGESRIDKMLNIRARFCQLVMVGEDNVTPLFSKDEVDALSRKSAKVLNRIFDEARVLSGFTEKDVKELEKN